MVMPTHCFRCAVVRSLKAAELQQTLLTSRPVTRSGRTALCRSRGAGRGMPPGPLAQRPGGGTLSMWRTAGRPARDTPEREY
jgi:hypothetical protein